MKTLNKFLFFIVLATGVHADWNEYKSRFLQDDGRIVDKFNNNITHSESIGYTLYFAYIFEDDETFDKVYNWYSKNLKKNEYGLVPWKWGKDVDCTWGILDMNNATDGDLWIAYDLLLMGKKRTDIPMINEGFMLLNAIKKHLIVKQGEKHFLLPGKEGYSNGEAFLVNLSYYNFNIIDFFTTVDNSTIWKDLLTDGEWLLNQTMFSSLELHPDWISVDANLSIKSARNNMFGYDAIRVPLNIMHSSLPTKEILLKPYKRYVSMMQQSGIPMGTVKLDKGDIHLYDFCFGHLAVYDKLLSQPIFQDKLKMMITQNKDNYYAYALYLFANL